MLPNNRTSCNAALDVPSQDPRYTWCSFSCSVQPGDNQSDSRINVVCASVHKAGTVHTEQDRVYTRAWMYGRYAQRRVAARGQSSRPVGRLEKTGQAP